MATPMTASATPIPMPAAAPDERPESEFLPCAVWAVLIELVEECVADADRDAGLELASEDAVDRNGPTEVEYIPSSTTPMLLKSQCCAGCLGNALVVGDMKPGPVIPYCQ